MPLEIYKKAKPSIKDSGLASHFLLEISFEVCNQLGGIYTVIRSKAPTLTSQWQEKYCMVGPYVSDEILSEVEKDDDEDFNKIIKQLDKAGIKAFYGTWLVTGRPKVLLLGNVHSPEKLSEAAHGLEQQFDLRLNLADDLTRSVLGFAISTYAVLDLFQKQSKVKVIAHFHEWMSSLPILQLNGTHKNISTVFTTHATTLGRYLASNEPEFYPRLKTFDWKQKAIEYNVHAIAAIERYSAQHAKVFTTVSEVTARECEVFYGKKPEIITPNGLNIQRFVALHEVHNLHQQYKEEINEFVMGHFFHSSPFDLDNTLYFFTSGRYEFKNKGYDITLEALNLLNKRLIKEKINKTIVTFFITRRDSWSINPLVLEQRGVMEEFRSVCRSIRQQLSSRLFYEGTRQKGDYRMPDLNNLIDDYWKLRYRRILQSWKSDYWPIMVTHNLKDDANDEIIQYLRKAPLVNDPKDKVKIVYHPDFISSTSPLFGIDYYEFIRGCHLGIFPSYYEPWGYTPLECLAHGIPAITSDLTGFGDYMAQNIKNHEESGGYVISRHPQEREQTVKELAEMMYRFTQSTRRERIAQRIKAEDMAELFDWSELIRFYNKAYLKATQ